MPEEIIQLEDRLRLVASDLCIGLRGAILSALNAQIAEPVGEVAPRAPGSSTTLRPVQLTSTLGLDKSLASRVVRSLNTDDPLRALHGVPTPQGLALIAAAAAKAGADEASLLALDAAATAYADLLSEFSGGRTDLEATLTGWLPEQRKRAERDARRSVFRGMTTLSGVRASAVYNSLYLLPGSEEGRVDTLVVAVRQDVRRLRTGAPLLVASLAADEGSGDWRDRRLALDGGPLATDGRGLLLKDLCSHPIPDLQLESSGRRIGLSIGPQSAGINEFVTLGFGWRTQSHFERQATRARSHGRLTFQTVWPTEALVVDLFVHSDLYHGESPVASLANDLTFQGAVPELDTTAGPPPPGDWRRASAPTVHDLSSHPSGLSSPKVRKCAAIAENACREAGLDPSSFVTFRVAVEFPLASEALTLWWALEPSG